MTDYNNTLNELNNISAKGEDTNEVPKSVDGIFTEEEDYKESGTNLIHDETPINPSSTTKPVSPFSSEVDSTSGNDLEIVFPSSNTGTTIETGHINTENKVQSTVTPKLTNVEDIRIQSGKTNSTPTGVLINNSNDSQNNPPVFDDETIPFGMNSKNNINLDNEQKIREKYNFSSNNSPKENETEEKKEFNISSFIKKYGTNGIADAITGDIPEKGDNDGSSNSKTSYSEVMSKVSKKIEEIKKQNREQTISKQPNIQQPTVDSDVKNVTNTTPSNNVEILNQSNPATNNVTNQTPTNNIIKNTPSNNDVNTTPTNNIINTTPTNQIPTNNVANTIPTNQIPTNNVSNTIQPQQNISDTNRQGNQPLESDSVFNENSKKEMESEYMTVEEVDLKEPNSIVTPVELKGRKIHIVPFIDQNPSNENIIKEMKITCSLTENIANTGVNNLQIGKDDELALLNPNDQNLLIYEVGDKLHYRFKQLPATLANSHKRREYVTDYLNHVKLTLDNFNKDISDTPTITLNKYAKDNSVILTEDETRELLKIITVNFVILKETDSEYVLLEKNSY